MNPYLITAVTTAALVVGYWLGTRNQLERIDFWADDHGTDGVWAWRWWLAAPVQLAQIVYVLVFHPRKSLHHIRTWNEPEPRVPAPVIDPDWAAKRAAAVREGNAR